LQRVSHQHPGSGWFFPDRGPWLPAAISGVAVLTNRTAQYFREWIRHPRVIGSALDGVTYNIVSFVDFLKPVFCVLRRIFVRVIPDRQFPERLFYLQFACGWRYTQGSVIVFHG